MLLQRDRQFDGISLGQEEVSRFVEHRSDVQRSARAYSDKYPLCSPMGLQCACYPLGRSLTHRPTVSLLVLTTGDWIFKAVGIRHEPGLRDGRLE